MSRKLIVTHHAPDLDAITATWLLKRFDSRQYADAHIAFVNPGDTITLEEAEQFGLQLHEVTHVDTGLGTFDHHQPERGGQMICAASLVYDYLLERYPDYKHDQALAEIVSYATEIDHFQEITWPEPDNTRYLAMIQELIRGLEFTTPNDDDAQMHFGMTCLDSLYATLTQHFKAVEILDDPLKTYDFSTRFGPAIGIQTRNSDVIKLAQKRGAQLVITKDPKRGNVRLKASPLSEINLENVAAAIKKKDTKGSWYFHPSGKMLLNGSNKHRNQTASPLTLEEVITTVKDTL
ncbi:MAG: hypothetical protein H6774_03130 [Pseudomonadales bacterium]|nr:hypothetical protein [Candidatus Woesebacteria bacterium]MCB9802057.1 hypothetical protein [Pseudomonadales bacterium]